jgi:DNA-binding PadR family transcriptional regulator
MRRPLAAAEPARYALLGLLIDGPRHGYDLARFFAPGSALGAIVRLSASQLYALLNRLEQDELIAGHREDAGSHPPRRVYRIEPAGRDAVLDWVSDPVTHPREMLIEFPVKLYLARRLGAHILTPLIDRQRALFSQHLERHGAEIVPADNSADAAFVALVHEGRMGRVRAALEWLDRCEASPWLCQEQPAERV